jgi:hypothetical protein
MALAQQVRLTADKGSERRHDTTILLLGYSVFAIVMVIAIYLASGGPGTEFADFATMSTFP